MRRFKRGSVNWPEVCERQWGSFDRQSERTVRTIMRLALLTNRDGFWEKMEHWKKGEEAGESRDSREESSVSPRSVSTQSSPHIRFLENHCIWPWLGANGRCRKILRVRRQERHGRGRSEGDITVRNRIPAIIGRFLVVDGLGL